jgi:hypothetical protein
LPIIVTLLLCSRCVPAGWFTRYRCAVFGGPFTVTVTSVFVQQQ